MKSKMTLLKSSLTRRLLSAVLAAAMVAGLLPASALAAGSANRPDPVYNPRRPEVGILNAYTGTSTALYKEIRNAANSYSYWPDRYDAFPALFHTLGTINTGSFEWDSSYTESYADSTLRELSKVYGNLEVNISATFKNDTHTHTHGGLFNKSKYEITDYEKVYLEVGPYTPVLLAGVYPAANADATKPMVGDYDGLSNENMSSDAKNATDSYGIVRYSNDNTTFKVHFIGMDIGYYHGDELKICTCNNTSADFPMMTFRDARAPQVAGVYYSLDGGTTWTQSTSGLRVKENSTLLIKLSFDEPIRFSDDSAVGKGDLYLELQADAASTGYENRRAYLTKLDGNDLYFSYTFSEQNVNWDIQTLNMSSMFGSNLPLVQVDRSGHFDPRYVPTGDTTGFTTTTCYITDLAGNALATRTVPSGDLNLDSERPYLKNVQFDLSLNNTDVKEALNKTDPSDNDYTDASDLYLGVGDSVSLVLNMNERLKIDTLTDWTAVATTNIKDENDSYITVTSQYYTPRSEGVSGSVTSWVMEPITMKAGWTVSGEGGKIVVTSLRFTGGSTAITDLAGNPLDTYIMGSNDDYVTIADGANANPPQLDVTVPTVTDGGETQLTDLGGFCYKVSIADDASGYAGLNGEFILGNGTGGDGKNYSFQYAVNATGNTPSEADWKDGRTGRACSFEQVTTVYIFIRPKDDETYGSLSGCTLTVKAKDFAGNVSDVTLPSSGALNWYIDNQAPTVTAGETTRALKDDPSQGGTLTVNFTLSDSHGIARWDWGWSSSGTTEPTIWTAVAVNEAEMSQTSITKAVTADVANGESFSKFLWVKATDNSNKTNAASVCLGKYTYDLSAAQYELSYTTDITRVAQLKVPSVGSTDYLFFLVRDGSAAADSAYAVFRLSGTGEWRGDIFDGTDGWIYGYTYTVDDKGIYTLTKTEDTAVQESLANTITELSSGKYNGELSVVILSGKTAALSDTTREPTTLTLGNDTYRFSQDTVTLKVSGNNVMKRYRDVTITSSSPLGGNAYGTATLESPHRSSLAGMEFTISIAEDLNGWNYADVNWDKSYVRLSQGVGSGIDYDFYLSQGQINIDDGSITTTLTIREGDYANGTYIATLYLSCTAYVSDTDYPVRFDGYITVNSVQPNSDFSLTSMTYSPGETYDKYGINTFYGTLDCLNGGGLITLPVSHTDGGTFSTADYKFTISSPTEQPVDGSWYKLQMWNTTYPTQTVTIDIDPADASQTEVKDYFYDQYGDHRYGFVFTEDKAYTYANGLYLVPNQENVVAMQKVYSNGLKSEVKYIYIKPVTEKLTGAVSIDSSTNELVFTPTDGISTVGAKVYAWAWQDGQKPLQGEGERIDMTPAPDGTWRCALAENGAMYEVITVTSAGVVCDAGGINERAPWFGTSGIICTDNNDGTYELRFSVSDDYETIQNGLNLDISFNNDYSDDHLAFTVKKGSNGWSADNTASNVRQAYSWTETGVSSTGIYSVEVEKWADTDQRDYLIVTVKGCFKNVTGSMTATVTATDSMGYTVSASTTQAVNYQQPVIYGDDAADGLKPTVERYGLALNFSQPVRPVDSWAWQEADSSVTGFHTQWVGAFPIIGNGTYELQFVDIFGNVQTKTLTTNAFTIGGKDYSVDLSFSNSNLTGEPVTVTASTTDGYLTFWDGFLIWKEDGKFETIRLIDENGTEWPESPIRLPNGTPIPEDQLKNFGMKLRAIRWSTNGKMEIGCASTSYAENNAVFFQTVYIGNIAKTAPAADVRYFIYALGDEFTQAELEQYIADNGGSVTVTGNVEVWYKTTRSVTPTEGGSQYLFTPENYEAGHTFAYADDAGNTASVTVTLPKGLTLEAPAVPPEDTTAPTVSVDIYTKISGSYTRAEAFGPGDTDITERFERLGYVQGYSLTVNASDASGYDIAVTGDGAALSGNVVTITKAGTFTITVTDRSSNHNATSVTFTVPAKIDNTPPVGDIAVTDNSLYEKTLTITLTDTDDAGQDTGNGTTEDTVTLSLPVGATRIDKNKYEYSITDNGAVEFVFYDQAGNRGTASESVSGIDTEPPTLSVTWSPARAKDSDLPPEGPVNTAVTARIRSDKAMYNLTVQAANETTAHDLLVAGETRYYEITDGNYVLAFFIATPELVTVTYYDNYTQPLTFTATAPNGKSTTLTLYGLDGVIDWDAPVITVDKKNQCRRWSPTLVSLIPYEIEVTLTPNEPVTSPNYGETKTVNGVKQPVEYDSDNPLVLTFTENGVYNVRFVDKAGNVTTVPVDLTASGFWDTIDNTAPKLTVTTVEENNQVKVTVTADEDCTLTWGDTGELDLVAGDSETITLTENGTYIFTAEDGAINKSYKAVWVYSIDKVAPSITFKSSTIYVMEDSDPNDLADALNTGYTAWDNVTEAGWPQVSIDSSVVDLDTAGQYTVTYTVTDKAGNTTTANRLVRVIGSDTVCLNIDGKLILPDSTAVIRPGDHTLTLENNGDEPYSIKARKGILSAGQMKYLSGSSLSFDENGNFSVSSTGYYTLLVTTQSRQTIRILLYVEQ
ncbi:MAG: immunoglobulin-like domain-containing protein [Oscillospiraceae bacterium]